MVVVMISFALSNTFPFVINFIEASNQCFFTDPTTFILAFKLNDVSNLLVVVNASTTIFIYLVFSQKYRLKFLHLLLRRPINRRSYTSGFVPISEPMDTKFKYVFWEDFSINVQFWIQFFYLWMNSAKHSNEQWRSLERVNYVMTAEKLFIIPNLAFRSFVYSKHYVSWPGGQRKGSSC